VIRFRLLFTPEASSNLAELENDASQRAEHKAILKCLGYMETNLRHPSLNTHKLERLKGPLGQQVFEAYAQNETPGAYRIIWYYGPGLGVITIAAIVTHL